MTVADVWTFITAAGVPGLLFLALVGLFAEFWYPRHVYKALERDRDEWKAIALQSMATTSTAVEELKERRPRVTK